MIKTPYFKMINFSLDNYYLHSLVEAIDTVKSYNQEVVCNSIDGLNDKKKYKLILVVDGAFLSDGVFLLRRYLRDKKYTIFVIASKQIINIMSAFISDKINNIIWIDRKYRKNEILLNILAPYNVSNTIGNDLCKNITIREMEVFKLFIYGFSYDDISVLLGLKYKTISGYKNKVLKKLKVKSLCGLLSYTTLEELKKLATNQPNCQ